MEANLSILRFDQTKKYNGILVMNTTETKKRPAFLIRLFSFVVMLFLLDFVIGSALRYFYFKQDSGLLYRTTYSMDSTRAEILIFGSSTANHHYVPGLFTNNLHLSC